jgi:hypothetical protein
MVALAMINYVHLAGGIMVALAMISGLN